jgi:hypothetical protein
MCAKAGVKRALSNLNGLKLRLGLECWSNTLIWICEPALRVRVPTNTPTHGAVTFLFSSLLHVFVMFVESLSAVRVGFQPS